MSGDGGGGGHSEGTSPAAGHEGTPPAAGSEGTPPEAGRSASAAASRRRIVAGNWKMHLLEAQAAGFCAELRRGLEEVERTASQAGPKVVLFPSFPLIPRVARELAGSGVEVGGQDLHPADQGAHTGDVSAPQLAGAGCRWALCGHSERRRDHGESDELIARKLAAAARHGLTPVLCVGESRQQRESGATLEVLERQVRSGLHTHPGPPSAVVVAYEPVWAIGTGLTASPETAQQAHEFLRRAVCGLLGVDAEAVTLLYGGSVTPANAAGLIAQPEVDGFLVGGASLDPRQFLAIIACSG
jgi:triosephosphate isomerase (TIM)